MKSIISTLLFLITVVSVYAQTDWQIVNNGKVVGKNLKTNTDIKGIEYIFPERIQHTYIDTLLNSVTVQLRGITGNEKYLKSSGNVLLYDLAGNNVKWSKKINYSEESIEQKHDIMILTGRVKSYCINMETGENKWVIPNRIYYIDAKQNIGIGYKIKMIGSQNTLQGINLQTGEELWKRDLTSNYEWDNNSIYKWDGAIHLNDSVLVVLVRGLHAMNVKTGKGWDYETYTGTYDMRGPVGDMISNIVVDSSNIYLASKTNLTRLNHDGKIEWSQTLPEDFASKSSIFIRDSLLCMVNKGYGIANYKQVSYGKPFLAAFNLKTGLQNYFAVVLEKKQQINGYWVNKDTVLLAFKNRISKYALIDGSMITEKTVEVDSLGELKYFVGGLVYMKAGATYKSLESIDSTKNYLWTAKDKILTVNQKLEVSNDIDVKQLYICYLITKDYRFIAKENETIVLDKAGNVVAELQASANAELIGSKLYDVQGKNFIEFDVNELVKGGL